MYEYEFRIVVQCEDYENVLKEMMKYFQIKNLNQYSVYYIRPHYRFKNRSLEWKQVVSHVTVYHDGLWFKMVESEEILFKNWSKNLTEKFLKYAGHYSNPMSIEYRKELIFPSSTNMRVYGFQKNDLSGLVFELEFGNYNCKQNIKSFLNDTETLLNPYKRVYEFFKHRSPLPYTLKECTRKPVIPITEHLCIKKNILMAKKYDGIFGFVYSYSNKIREVWEDNKRRLRPGITLGDGIVFGAEKMADGIVILLDVYQVRGSPVLCSRKLLTEFLPSILNSLPPNYKIQRYFGNSSSSFDIKKLDDNTDGYIFHDTESDTIYKIKSKHTLDLLHFDGYFLLPNNKRRKVPKGYENLKNGVVYECSIDDLKPLKKRKDRFVGNSAKQIKNILSLNE